MEGIGAKIQTADWKSEKHVPVIECPDQVQADAVFEATVSLGKEIAHPNTTAHHIRWITLYYQPDGDKFVHEVAHLAFSAHGESAQGADTGPVYTHHTATASLKISKSGTLHAVAYCNIHGLWQYSRDIAVVG